MNKNVWIIFFVVIILVLLGAFIWQSQNLKQASHPIVIPEPVQNEPAEVATDTNIEILSLMEQAAPILGVEGEPLPTEMLAATVKWATGAAELDLNGVGYAFGDEMNAESILAKYAELNQLLADEGFMTDPTNAVSDMTSRFKRGNVICNLTKEDRTMSLTTSLIFTCADMDNKMIIFEAPGIGGERDQYGCLGPAGYGWDSDIHACIRPWELDEESKRAAEIATLGVNWSRGLTVLEVTPTGCDGCFTVILDDSKQRIQVNIENWLMSSKMDLTE